MEIASKYNPAEVEGKWYQYWLDNGFFKSKPDGREPYTIVIPPPNVTGVLHMGHMLNNTIQDILIRRARMQGKNACWVPGTDHASIATEAKVVNRLAQQGIKKTDLTREDFLKHAWEWKEEHGGIILKQLRKLGASCDWDRTAFTMDEKRSESVLKVFVDLYNKGLIYRGVRMVNWDPKALTALSDEEVIYKEDEKGKKLEPFEIAVIDVPDEFSGTVINMLNQRKGELQGMAPTGNGTTRLEFSIPSRGLIGFRGDFMTATKGNGIINTMFDGYQPYKGDMNYRSQGSLIAFESGESITYGLFNAQERGTLFIGPGEQVYGGMVVGQCGKAEDIEVNVCKKKQLTNTRASGSDDALKLTPPKILSLEQALDFIDTDELLEITPKSIRIRKKILDPTLRMRAKRAMQSN